MEKEADAFYDYVKNIQSEGGAFGKACALEALSLALKSDQVKDGQKRRHIAVVFSDSKPYALGGQNGRVGELFLFSDRGKQRT